MEKTSGKRKDAPNFLLLFVGESSLVLLGAVLTHFCFVALQKTTASTRQASRSS